MREETAAPSLPPSTSIRAFPQKDARGHASEGRVSACAFGVIESARSGAPGAVRSVGRASMVWDHRKLLDYIKKSAPVSASTNLLKANFKAYRTKGLVPAVDRSPRLFITYYSMPDWLDLFTFQAYDLPRIPFA